MATSSKPPPIWIVVLNTLSAWLWFAFVMMTTFDVASRQLTAEMALGRVFYLLAVLAAGIFPVWAVFLWVVYFRRYVAYQIDRRFSEKGSDA